MSTPPPPTAPYVPVHANLLREWQTWALNPSSSGSFSFTDEELETHNQLVTNIIGGLPREDTPGTEKAREDLTAWMRDYRERKEVVAQQMALNWMVMGRRQLEALEKAEKRIAELENKIQYIRDKLYEGEGNGAAAPAKQSSA